MTGGSLCTPVNGFMAHQPNGGFPKSSKIGGEPMVVDTPSWETVEVGYPWWAHTLLLILRIQKHPLLWFDKFEPFIHSFIHVRSEFDKTWLDCVVTLNISKHISISAPLICAIPTVFLLWAVVPSAEPFALSYMGMDQYLLIPFLVGWTSIYQLFWGSLGTRVLTNPHIYIDIYCVSCTQIYKYSTSKYI